MSRTKKINSNWKSFTLINIFGVSRPLLLILPLGFESDSTIFSFSAKTCFTHLCSSIKNALTIWFRTERALLDPPGALLTFLSRYFNLLGEVTVPSAFAAPWTAYWLLRTWYTNLPPGVFTMRFTLLLVMYRCWRRYVRRCILKTPRQVVVANRGTFVTNDSDAPM